MVVNPLRHSNRKCKNELPEEKNMVRTYLPNSRTVAVPEFACYNISIQDFFSVTKTIEYYISTKVVRDNQNLECPSIFVPTLHACNSMFTFI